VDEIYFIVGADSFLQLQTWHRYEQLLESCDFIVASRPGFPLARLSDAIPKKLSARAGSLGVYTLGPRKHSVHLLAGTHSGVSSTEIRRRLARGNSIQGLVPAAVEDYIRKQAIYR